MIKLIRTYIAFFFMGIAARIAPWPRPGVNKVAPPPEPDEEKVTPSSPTKSTVHYKDAASYFEQLKKPDDLDAAAISICNNLKEISASKKGPVRLCFNINSYYDARGEKQLNCSGNISAYGKGRWYKLCDIPLEPKVTGALVREMIEAMAQDGWACMNDSAEQLSGYFSNCLTNNRNYLLQYCKKHGTQGRLRGQITMVVDVNLANVKRSDSPPPHIMHKVSIWNGNVVEPIESAHFIYFMRAEKETAKA